jgi:hypothetical protein
MRTMILVIAAFISVINASVTSRSQSPTSTDAGQQKQRLKLEVFTEKHVYKRDDKLNLKVMVINASDQDIFVYGDLGWGHLASLTICLTDARGNDIQPKFISDAVTYPPDDNSQFVKLLPFHFLGTSYVASIEDLNMQRPGKYSIYIEYHSPIRNSKANVSPFFGKENGVIRSNPISIEVQ